MELEKRENNDLNENLYEENASIKKVLDLMKELTEVEAKRALVNTAKVGKEVKIGLDKKIQNIKNWVESGERKYGPKQGLAKEIEKEYANTVAEIYETFEETKKECLERKETYQKVEQYEYINIQSSKIERQLYKKTVRTLKNDVVEVEKSDDYKYISDTISKTQKDLQKAVKDMDTKKISSLNTDLKSFQKQRENLFEGKKEIIDDKSKEIDDLKLQIKISKQNLIDTRNNIKNEYKSIDNIAKISVNAMNIAEKNKNKELAVIQKENTVSKFLNNIISKVGGTKKFINNIVEPIKEEIKTLKEEVIPDFKANVLIDITEKEIRFNNFMDNTKENIKHKVQSGKDNISNIAGQAITAGKSLAGLGKDIAIIVSATGYIAGYEVANNAKNTIEKAIDKKDQIKENVSNTARNIIDNGMVVKTSFLNSVAKKVKEKIEYGRLDILNKQQTKIKNDEIYR